MKPELNTAQGSTTEVEIVKQFLSELDRKPLRGVKSRTASVTDTRDYHAPQTAEDFTLVPTAEAEAVKTPSRAERMAERRNMKDASPRRAARDLLPVLEEPEALPLTDDEIFDAARAALTANTDRDAASGQRPSPIGEPLRIAAVSIATAIWPYGALTLAAVWFSAWAVAFFSLGADRLWNGISQLLPFIS